MTYMEKRNFIKKLSLSSYIKDIHILYRLFIIYFSLMFGLGHSDPGNMNGQQKNSQHTNMQSGGGIIMAGDGYVISVNGFVTWIVIY